MTGPVHHLWARAAATSVLVVLALPIRARAAEPQGADSAAPKTATHAIYGELFGNGLLYSINYEHRLTPHLWGRAGFEMLRRSSALVPVMVSFLTGKGRNHLELGAGALVGVGVFNGEDVHDRHLAAGALVITTIGYRYQRPGGGWIVRAGATPFPWLDGASVVWFGFSVGRAF